MMEQKKSEYNKLKKSMFSESLFPNPGILELDGAKDIKLTAIDARTTDLSAFKARLFENKEPFQITAERLYVDDEYCAVSYNYDAGYADRQVKKGGGLFWNFINLRKQ